MSQWRYGDPATGQAPNKPGCYGKSYDNENRDCRQCPWMENCRGEIIRNNNQRMMGAAPPHAAPPQTYAYAPPSYAAAPPQAPQVPVRIEAPVAPRTTTAGYYPPQPAAAPPPPRGNPAPPAPAAPRPQAPQPQGSYASTPLGVYGAIPDPMFHTIHQAPAPFRPQMQGEHFLERVGKNMFLSMLEAVAKEAVLAIRQVFLPPQVHVPQGGPPGQQVVDGTFRKA